MNKPKISIITVCFNSDKTIADTLNSVNNQDYTNLEHIIVDGASEDNTLQLIDELKGQNTIVVSEKDHGLYDALNKGLKMASGEVIGILHSDDYLAATDSISKIAELFVKNPGMDAVSASVDIIKPGNPDKLYRKYNAKKFKIWQIRLGIQPPHPGFYIKKEAFDKVGFFNAVYKISGDFDWFIRVFIKEKLNVLFTDLVVVRMRHGGVSSSGNSGRKLMNRENLRALKTQGIYSNLFLIYSKYIFKIFQIRF